MPKITVIITAYKDRGWINDAILSAKDQSFKDYDIIFVSDGNPDLKVYADNHDIPFYLFPKSNYAITVNLAVAEARGKWIKVLHDDDLLTPNCLTDLYNARINSDLVYANAIIFYDNDYASSWQYKPPSEITLKKLLPIITNPVNFEAELFKRDMFLKIGGFDTNLGYAEDYDLLLNLLSRGYKITYCDKDVVWYRHHARQITGNEPAMREAERDYLLKKYMDVIVNQIQW